MNSIFRPAAARPNKKRIVILGGGFGGVYAAIHLEKLLAGVDGVEICLVSHDNFFLFTPMLHEVAASDLEITNIINPLRKLLRRVDVVVGAAEQIDLPNKRVSISHGYHKRCEQIEYDHLVIALGSVTNFYDIPGLADLAVPMKSLRDAIRLRTQIIRHLEEANSECNHTDRQSLLTFIVADGGFAGVETVAALNDFVREALPFYPNLCEGMLRVMLVHSGAVILPELGESLGRYCPESPGRARRRDPAEYSRQRRNRRRGLVSPSRPGGLSNPDLDCRNGAVADCLFGSVRQGKWLVPASPGLERRLGCRRLRLRS